LSFVGGGEPATHLLSVFCLLSLSTSFSLFLSFIFLYLSFHLLFVICLLLFVSCYLSLVICLLLFVFCLLCVCGGGGLILSVHVVSCIFRP
jgi:hypothetical protein